MTEKPKWPADRAHRIDDMVEQFEDRIAVADRQTTRVTYMEMSQRIGAINSTLSRNWH
ncbi:uncharacterized protein LY79DRAFT_542323 [Colletotrichum navitas]|uniref:Uncharacterized protein n=1 Tax=Colletotrichum navitas TaxID=681940 RepID=A0AAD8V9D1_9PEZI|nr:uncharacterized protein LY79DRAFT_542323 [Colletotrichum navitas]KAK1597153.1 hypothetical protein LY79DRAFT_542323 [Colletotrichum navitas]